MKHASGEGALNGRVGKAMPFFAAGDLDRVPAYLPHVIVNAAT